MVKDEEDGTDGERRWITDDGMWEVDAGGRQGEEAMRREEGLWCWPWHSATIPT